MSMKRDKSREELIILNTIANYISRSLRRISILEILYNNRDRALSTGQIDKELEKMHTCPFTGAKGMSGYYAKTKKILQHFEEMGLVKSIEIKGLRGHYRWYITDKGIRVYEIIKEGIGKS